MQQTPLETIAQAIAQRQDRYQRTTPLFGQLVHLLAQGQPVPPERLARLLQWDRDEVFAILREHPELEYDAQGNVIGSGLTLVPTTHQVRIEQQTLFTWCAFDTLTYPVDLQVSAQITSRCPVTGQTIHLTVTPDQVRDLDPRDAQISLVVEVAAECCSQNVRKDVCNYGHFFAEPVAAALWQATHPQVVILSVEEAYQVGKLVERYHAPKGEKLG